MQMITHARHTSQISQPLPLANPQSSTNAIDEKTSHPGISPEVISILQGALQPNVARIDELVYKDTITIARALTSYHTETDSLKGPHKKPHLEAFFYRNKGELIPCDPPKTNNRKKNSIRIKIEQKNDQPGNHCLIKIFEKGKLNEKQYSGTLAHFAAWMRSLQNPVDISVKKESENDIRQSINNAIVSLRGAPSLPEVVQKPIESARRQFVEGEDTERLLPVEYPQGAYIENDKGDVVAEILQPVSHNKLKQAITELQGNSVNKNTTKFIPVINNHGTKKTLVALVKIIPGMKPEFLVPENDSITSKFNIGKKQKHTITGNSHNPLLIPRELQWQVAQLSEGVAANELTMLNESQATVIEQIAQNSEKNARYAELNKQENEIVLEIKSAVEQTKLNPDIKATKDGLGVRIANTLVGLFNMALGSLLIVGTFGMISWAGIPAIVAGINQVICGMTGRGLGTLIGGMIGGIKGERIGRWIDNISNIGVSMAVGWFFSYTSAIVRAVFGWDKGISFNQTEMANSGFWGSVFLMAQQIKNKSESSEYEQFEAKKLLSTWGDPALSAEKFAEQRQKGFIPMLSLAEVSNKGGKLEITLKNKKDKSLYTVPDSERTFYPDGIGTKGITLKLSEYIKLLKNDAGTIDSVAKRLGKPAGNREGFTGLEAVNTVSRRISALNIFDKSAIFQLCCAAASHNICLPREAVVIKSAMINCHRATHNNTDFNYPPINLPPSLVRRITDDAAFYDPFCKGTECTRKLDVTADSKIKLSGKYGLLKKVGKPAGTPSLEYLVEHYPRYVGDNPTPSEIIRRIYHDFNKELDVLGGAIDKVSAKDLVWKQVKTEKKVVVFEATHNGISGYKITLIPSEDGLQVELQVPGANSTGPAPTGTMGGDTKLIRYNGVIEVKP